MQAAQERAVADLSPGGSPPSKLVGNESSQIRFPISIVHDAPLGRVIEFEITQVRVRIEAPKVGADRLHKKVARKP